MVAIAVIAIGLTAVLGLLPGAIQSGRNAADNTLAATIVQDIFSNVRSTPFTLNNRACQYCALHDLPTFTGTDVPIHYDQEGNEINPASPTLNLQHYYLVTLQYTPQPTPPPPAALSIVTASIAWPANAPLTKQSKSTFVTEIAQYQ
jgi:type II secretory pathway pseudopilin PulG